MRALLILLVFLFSFLQYKLWIAEGKVQDLWALKERIESLKSENESLMQRNHTLQAEVENLKSGLDVIEEKARQEFGWVGKEETFFQFIEPTDDK